MRKDTFETKKQTRSKIIIKTHEKNISWTAELWSQDVSKLQKQNRNYYSMFVPTAPSYLPVASTQLEEPDRIQASSHSALSLSKPCSCMKTTVSPNSSCSCDLIKNISKKEGVCSIKD